MKFISREDRNEHNSKSPDHGSLITPLPVSWQAIGLTLFIGVAAASVFLFTASYGRVEVVSGVIVPEDGVSSIIAVRQGVVSEIFVKNGELVKQNTNLVAIRAEEDSQDEQSTSALILNAIRSQDASIAVQSSAASIAAVAQIAQFDAQQSGLKSEIEQIESQISSQSALISLANSDVDRARLIADRGFISKKDIEARETVLISRQQVLSQLIQALASKRSQMATNAKALEQITAQNRAQQAQLAAARAEVEQRAAGVAGSRFYVLRAPVAGTVTAMSARVGQPAAPQSQMMVIVPSNSKLRAELSVPSTAIGFVKPGQNVTLAIDAFPYQRYGVIKGRVESVSGSAITDQASRGNTTSFYPIIVSLSTDAVNAYGRAEPLVAGMTLTARIVTRKQSLFEWLFDPLFAVGRR